VLIEVNFKHLIWSSGVVYQGLVFCLKIPADISC